MVFYICYLLTLVTFKSLMILVYLWNLEYLNLG